MSGEESEYQQQDYIGAREQQAYLESGGAEANMAMMTPVPGGMVGGMLQRMRAQEQASAVASTYGTHQAQTLSQNHRLWDKPSALGSTHYLSFPHKELTRFVNEKFDPQSVHEAGRYYNKVGNDLVEFSGRIRTAATKTEQSWQGAAGDAMRGKMTQLSDHMGHSGEAAQLTGNQLGMQAEAGQRARNSMPEVVEVDVAAEMQQIANNPDPVTAQQQANALEDKQAKSQAAHQEAAQVVGTMERDFGSAATMTPKFAPPPPPPAEDGGGSGAPAGGTGGVGGFVSPTGGSGGTPSSTYSASAAPGTAPPATGGSYTPGTSGPQAPAGTSSSWANPGSLPPGVTRGPDGTLYRQDPRTGQWMRQNPHNGRWAPVPPGQAGPGGGRGGAGGGRAGGATGGPGGGRAGGGFGPRGAGSVPGSPPGPGGQSGGRVAGTPGSATPSSSSASSSSSSARGGGRMPMGGMGGQNQQGDEEEHERKYLLDTDEAWDDLGIQRVAPPVLGALPNEDGGS